MGVRNTPEPAVIGAIFDGRYRIIRELGRGGMGAVYEAEHIGIGKKVAVKLLSAVLATDSTAAMRFFTGSSRCRRVVTSKFGGCERFRNFAL